MPLAYSAAKAVNSAPAPIAEIRATRMRALSCLKRKRSSLGMLFTDGAKHASWRARLSRGCKTHAWAAAAWRPSGDLSGPGDVSGGPNLNVSYQVVSMGLSKTALGTKPVSIVVRYLVTRLREFGMLHTSLSITYDDCSVRLQNRAPDQSDESTGLTVPADWNTHNSANLFNLEIFSHISPPWS